MAIIEVSNAKEFLVFADTTTPDRYKLIWAKDENRLVLRPIVTTRGVDTYVLKGANQMLMDDLVIKYGRVFVCNRIMFDEEKYRD